VPEPNEQRRIVVVVERLMSLLDDLEAKLRKQEETATRLAESLAAAVAA
jgi:restriction endonuclease S subunit